VSHPDTVARPCEAPPPDGVEYVTLPIARTTRTSSGPVP
jgi:hypothetical protein